ncbi:MAG: permease-like cell division protein FtsX [Clostridia bacterium]|nr:permease-like cell division protein FtsX [Clostridia bacterium]
MNKLRAFFYIIKLSLENLLKNWHMLLASVFVLFTGMYIMGTLLLTSNSISSILSEQAEHPEVEVICRSELSDDDALSIYRVILSDERISRAHMNTKADNLEKIKETLKGYEDIFQYESEDSEFLYVSFDITLKNAASLEGFSNDMRRVSGVEEVQDNDSIYKYFRGISNVVRTGSIVALIVLGFLSVLLTVNTIRLTVVARKKELRIMRDLGASYAFMRGPFIAEGVTIGLLSAAISFFAVRGTYNYVAKVIERGDNVISTIIRLKPFSEYSHGLLWGFILAGLAIGLVASMFAIRKYINTERDDDK